MSSSASLILVRGAAPRRAAELESDTLGRAAGYVPLGWMALFRATDLRVLPDAPRGALTCFTTVAAARGRTSPRA